MRIFVVANVNGVEKNHRSQSVISQLRAFHGVSASEVQATALEDPALACFPAKEADLIVSIGGDGTLLQASHIAYEADKPLLGINTGHLGALTAGRPEDLDFANLLDGLTLSLRQGLIAEAMGESLFALNEVILSSPTRAKATRLSYRFDDEEEKVLRGDGLCVATPTGSTAYARSCGGPILNREEKSFIFLPLAPIPYIEDRATVYPSSRVLRIDTAIAPASPSLCYDGIDVGCVSGTVAVSAAPRPLRLYIGKP